MTVWTKNTKSSGFKSWLWTAGWLRHHADSWEYREIFLLSSAYLSCMCKYFLKVFTSHSGQQITNEPSWCTMSHPHSILWDESSTSWQACAPASPGRGQVAPEPSCHLFQVPRRWQWHWRWLLWANHPLWVWCLSDVSTYSMFHWGQNSLWCLLSIWLL